MRGTRWLFLAAIACILVFVSATYFKRKENLASEAPPPPKPLPETCEEWDACDAWETCEGVLGGGLVGVE